MTDLALPRLLRHRPSWRLGAGVAVLAVGACTAVVAALGTVTAASALAVLYLLPVLLVSLTWGFRLGAATALGSALVFNVAFLPPVGRVTIADERNLAALGTFVVVAFVTSRVAHVARSRTLEAEARREEADLTADLARGLLGGGDPATLLATAAGRVAAALGVPAAALEPGTVAARPGTRAHPLRIGDRTLATLLLPAGLDPHPAERLERHLLPALEALLAAADQRDALQADAVEAQALRRSDVLKTALLRAVSHDLRSPLTAILTAGTALGSPALEPGERAALAADVVGEAERLATVVGNLLDLSRLEAGTAEPRPDWCAVDEVLHAAAEHVPGADVRFAIDPSLPLVRADAAQLERAFTNLVANAARHGESRPVSVRARAVGGRLVVRVVDGGAGIAAADQERIFEPFWRGGDGAGAGSGLGLAIVRGFVEVNGGDVRVESRPGQGASFVVSFPIPAPGPVAATAS